MKTLSLVLVYGVGILHLGFMVLESFLWTTPLGLKVFRMSADLAQTTKVLALNQGLYNGFLAAGLFWGAYAGEMRVISFFLICVIIAGFVGGLSASRNIIFVQALPALVALLMMWLTRKS